MSFSAVHCLLLQGLLDLFHAVTLKVQVQFKSIKNYAVELRGAQPLQKSFKEV